ncbi:DUF1553 domain-containing protein [Planctomyces sp. SH-PL62]|uniref:DUF1553 domain-containing protein n=1 Tax=Planctomyces sp. SH-PL62 TaxID=1636152 RepID=UPI00078E3E15|nr:DUF1553 domain-containing protein [Planctomyces sp. SH-PL62]AMV39090.1 Planctomycete cytochrome C [Planctomyces sp. SH-PL62]
MRRRTWVGLGLAMSFLLGLTDRASLVAAPPAPTSEKVDFERQVRAILSDKCFHCHGPDPKNRKAGLRLDSKDGAFGESKTGLFAIVPGDPDESELVARITSEDEGERMPPRALGRDLSPHEVEILTRWIEQGAEWKDHWAFVPPVRPPVPDIVLKEWERNPIDRFVLARLESEGLTPSPEASRERLIRRLSFDLTGLPPTLDEIDVYLNDKEPDAYGRVVDRLLASPRFGERMAVDWLDVARYADTFGYQADVYRAMWPWRDWVVRAFNANLPYDQFVTWQLAGDLLPEPSRDMILATAFNRHHRQTNEGGSIEAEWRTEYVADRTITYGAAFLGLTLECARCHTHKYDPITQKDFYSLFSFFNNIDESGLYSHFTPAVPTPTLWLTDEAHEKALSEASKRIRAAESELERLAEVRRDGFDSWLRDPARSEVVSAPLAGLLGDFPLDAIEEGKTVNRFDPSKSGSAAENPSVVEGRVGRAIRFDGENSLTLPMGNFDRFQPFSLALWIKTPDLKDRAVVLRRSMAWTDAGSRGYQLLIEEGRLTAALIHFWPGNAIGVASRDPLPINQWVHVVLTYDGSSRASGLKLHVDGRPAPLIVVRDNLTKTITGGGADDLVLGQRFRDRGFKDGEIDELQVFGRALTPVEATQLHDGKSLDDLLKAELASLANEDRSSLLAYYLANVDDQYKSALAAVEEARKELSRVVDPIDEIMVMKEMAEPRPTFVLKRGAYDAPGDQVSPATPESLLAFPPGQPRNRLGLARWTTDPRNPLMARVTVNRWWQSLFGRGLVSTPEDFGSQGQLPSHPELLDWLACELVDSGWNVKRTWRSIVTSATYRQSSDANAELYARDPENLLLARGPRERLSAEMMRDNALAVGGLLVGTIGGPPVKPFQPDGLWEEKSSQVYVRDVGPGSHRRSLYTYWKRTSPPPAMLTLDAANREVCSVRRLPTATPLQALVLLNDPQFVEAARALAERAFHEAGPTPHDRVVFLFRVLTGRRPDADESTLLQTLYREQYEEFSSGRADAHKLLAVGDAPRDPALDPVEYASLTVVAQALFNYDETVTKR